MRKRERERQRQRQADRQADRKREVILTMQPMIYYNM